MRPYLWLAARIALYTVASLGGAILGVWLARR